MEPPRGLWFEELERGLWFWELERGLPARIRVRRLPACPILTLRLEIRLAHLIGESFDYSYLGYLPHWSVQCASQFVTWRLHDSIPTDAWQRLAAEAERSPESERHRLRARLAEAVLDQGHGSAVLTRPDCAAAVLNSLLYWHKSRLVVSACVVMPNHVHALLTLAPGEDLPTLVHSVKSYSANRINDLTGGCGRVWQPEYFDRLIRDRDHFERTRRYIEWNPVKANLIEHPAHYRWSSAHPLVASRLANDSGPDSGS